MPIQYRRNVDARSDEGLARNFVPHPINTHWPRGFLVLPNEIFAVHIRIIRRDWLFASRESHLSKIKFAIAILLVTALFYLRCGGHTAIAGPSRELYLKRIDGICARRRCAVITKPQT